VDEFVRFYYFGCVFNSSAPEYAKAVQPHNSATAQHPALVAVPRTAEEVSASVEEAARQGLVVVPQASGHGAGAPVEGDALLLDTSALSSVSIDAAQRTATVGSGATWAAGNAAAEQHGLLGPSGSAPSVSVSGYSFAGGIGWLVRRDGLASAALRRVQYVDGSGALRLAHDDAADPLDREAMWAFRGAGGVGVATELEFDLFPASQLHAGKLLWHVEALDAVVAAWAGSLDQMASSVATSISVLHVPPAPPFPEELQGKVAVHLAVADPEGSGGAVVLLSAVRAAATPVADDWGPADASRLAQIHLDPPVAIPALGAARWLGDRATDIAVELFRTAVSDDSPTVMMEIRHVAGPPGRRPGALTAPHAPFIYHAVGPLGRATRDQIDGAFERAREVWRPADAGLTPGSWVEGSAAVAEALSTEARQRARSIADQVDPTGRIRRSRLMGPTH
jgi:FAD/FMN-containing dehydrogenase